MTNLQDLKKELQDAIDDFDAEARRIGLALSPCSHRTLTPIRIDKTDIVQYRWYECETCGRQIGVPWPSILAGGFQWALANSKSPIKHKDPERCLRCGNRFEGTIDEQEICNDCQDATLKGEER